jgi:TatD DNase family protein
MLELIDTHCHLHFDDYNNDRKAVLGASAGAGVNRLICVGCSLDDSKRAVDFARQHSGVWASIGSHPHEATKFLADPDSGIKFETMLKQPKVVAVGEIGLDYYRNYSPESDQEKALRRQLEFGLKYELPFIFHIREAWDDFWKIFDDYKNIKGVVHCYSAPPDRLEEVLERNLYAGLNGLMTYTKDQQWLEAAKRIPKDRLVLETDAPFLTPVPYRGKRCEPKHVADTAKFLANLRDENVEDLAVYTTANAVSLFGLGGERIS